MLLLNILEIVVSIHSNEECRFLRQPINLLYSYLQSEYFRDNRNQK